MNTELRPKPTAEYFCNELARLYQFFKMYPSGNANLVTSAEKVAKIISDIGTPIRFSRIGDDLFVEETVMAHPARQVLKLFDAFTDNRWESVRVEPGIGAKGILKVLERISSGHTGTFTYAGFAAGSFALDDDEPAINEKATVATGLLSFGPMISELFEDMSNRKTGTWLRAHDTIATLMEYAMSGVDLFGPVTDLKDYDEYTFTHAINVSLLTTAMAKSVNVSDRVLNAMAIGALCHDIGKTKIPLEVLRKPGKLTEREKTLMDRHPSDGAAIIMSIPGPCPALVPTIAFQHHMMADGGGYPVVPVNKIPHPASLLVSIADAFDAMRTVRPYKPTPASQAQALSALLQMANEGVYIRMFLSVLFKLIGIISPGRKIVLTDGRTGVVLAEGEYDVLSPLVEADESEILDLSIPGMPQIDRILD